MHSRVHGAPNPITEPHEPHNLVSRKLTRGHCPWMRPCRPLNWGCHPCPPSCSMRSRGGAGGLDLRGVTWAVRTPCSVLLLSAAFSLGGCLSRPRLGGFSPPVRGAPRAVPSAFSLSPWPPFLTRESPMGPRLWAQQIPHSHWPVLSLAGVG